LLAGPVGAPAIVATWPSTAHASGANLGGTITDADGDPVEDAKIAVQCACLTDTLWAKSNADGKWKLRGLPPGRYTIEIFAGKEQKSLNVTINPGQSIVAVDAKLGKIGEKIDVIVIIDPEKDTSEQGHVKKLTVKETEAIPTPGGRDDVVKSATIDTNLDEGAGGTKHYSATASELKVEVDSNNISPPSVGQPVGGMPAEFIEAMVIREGGYEAEYGGVTTSLIQARRAGGTNRFSAYARFTFSPRLAKPRVITTTDEALRVTQVPDWQITSALGVSGPIIKDRLFFNLGVSPQTTQFTLTQSFHHRVDNDGSGGFEDCPYENGDNDCATGANYIATRQFAEQKYRTGASGIGWQGVLDWHINNRHRLRLSGGGGPSFIRTTYRLPFAFDPSAFGTNPSTDPLSGASRIANGLVDGKFGTNLFNQTLVGLEYKGRFAKDSLEVDASVGYGRWHSVDAWRLDDPGLKDLPTTQESDNQGANLYQFLDKERAVGRVPGVEQACNASDLPGLACPVRTWLSGGIGQYGDVTAQRIGGRLHFTHFVNAHQIKYGAEAEHLSQRNVFRYSGSNGGDFYEDCPAGTKDLGEVCWDPDQKEYVFQQNSRVDNHRFIVVDTDNPDQRQSFGYGRPRVEQGDLRTIASPLGNGARMGAYDQTLSTDNYAAFVQDSWAALPNLYLSAGARWEIQDMKDALGDRALLIWDNIAPRVGLSYDWSGEGITRLYASYGWFYQNLPLQLNNRVFGGLSRVGRTYRDSDCVGVTTTQGGQQHDRSRNGQPTEWCVDAANFTTGLTQGAVVPRLRGMYNQQLQIGYDHEIIEDLVVGLRWQHTNLGRAVEDISTNGGLNYIIANPGEEVSPEDIAAQRSECDALQERFDELEALDPGGDANNAVARELQQCNFVVDAFEKVNTLFNRPQRNYDGFTFRVNKRFADNWILAASYTYSRLHGNYDGFVDPVTGAVNLGSSRQYDTPELVRNSFGPLSGDVPHRLKLDGAYTFVLQHGGALTLGSSFRLSSGVPINVRADNNRFPGEYGVYVLPRGAGGRVEPNYQWNLSLGYGYTFGKKHDVQLFAEARVLNVTNAKAVLRVDDVYSYSYARGIPGGDLSDLKHAKLQPTARPNDFFSRTIVPAQGNYGTETQFQQPLAAQFTLSLRY
jgi:hypothetical protein